MEKVHANYEVLLCNKFSVYMRERGRALNTFCVHSVRSKVCVLPLLSKERHKEKICGGARRSHIHIVNGMEQVVTTGLRVAEEIEQEEVIVNAP